VGKAADSGRYDTEAHAIKARDVRFDWNGVPLHYLPGEPVATQFYNAMHLLLPEAERAMAKALSDALPYITDGRLHEEAVGFIGQESTHASSHEGARGLLEANGVSAQPIIDRMNFLVERVLGDHGLTGRAKAEWLKERLGLFAAMEHFTAVVGTEFLTNEKLDPMHPTMLDLLRWHGAEEVEHRNVVYDVFQYIDGSYARRVRTAFLACALLQYLFLGTIRHLVKTDPSPHRSRRMWLDTARAMVRGTMPPLSMFPIEMAKYLRPGFHPSSMGDPDLARNYLATSPAARAAG
jgi:predicted metal-dependent hydrolase